MADSTRAMRRAIFEREMLPVWRNRLLSEIAPDDLRVHCLSIVERGAPATAIHVRDILKQIYAFAKLHGEKIANPADEVGPAAIASMRGQISRIRAILRADSNAILPIISATECNSRVYCSPGAIAKEQEPVNSPGTCAGTV